MDGTHIQFLGRSIVLTLYLFIMLSSVVIVPNVGELKCHNCGGNHFFQDCKEWKEVLQRIRSSLGNYWPGPLRPYGRVTKVKPLGI